MSKQVLGSLSKAALGAFFTFLAAATANDGFDVKKTFGNLDFWKAAGATVVLTTVAKGSQSPFEPKKTDSTPPKS